MIREVSFGNLIAILSTTNDCWARRPAEILGRQGVDAVVRLDAVPADELHRTYSVRLTAQREGRDRRPKISTDLFMSWSSREWSNCFQ